MTQPGDTPHGSDGGVSRTRDRPTEALTAFGDALAEAARAPAGRHDDSNVRKSFALGWQIAQLYRPHERLRQELPDGDLPALGALGDYERSEILVDQVQVGVAGLGEVVEAAGLYEVDVQPVRESLGEGDDHRTQAVFALHCNLLATLTATDFRLGKAYSLGCTLADACRKPKDAIELKRELAGGPIANARRWLDDLSSALPPHAAHSVEASLGRWVDWAAEQPNSDIPAASVSMLRRQGELWRALLSGEKRGSEMLEIGNYVEAARALAHRMRAVVREVVLSFPLLAVMIVLLLAGGIALLALGGGSDIVAGATSVVVAVGLSWRTLGATAGRLAGRVEQPLYDALLDTAITDAITLLADNKSDHRGRRALAVQLASRTSGPQED